MQSMRCMIPTDADVSRAGAFGHAPRRSGSWRICGFTLIELLLSVTILGILLTTAVATYNVLDEKQSVNEAISDVQAIEALLARFFTESNSYPSSLAEIPAAASLRDPWGNPYQYLNIAETHGNGQVRKDHNLVPLNTDYDLYSLGEDGRSVSPLTAQASRDDIVRANNGGFVGLAANY
jgi:general secretion pathway protein G